MKTIKEEANRCLKCKNPKCSLNCPVHTPIPEVVNKFIEGKIEEAGRILFTNNPLSAITSIVCPHERNCHGHCVLNAKNEPVEFYRIEQYVSHYYLETMKLPNIVKNGKKMAVIGSGPSGLTMSLVLALNGFDVTLFEEEEDIGGVLRYGIPGFRLSKQMLGLYRQLLVNMGVKLRLNTRFGLAIDAQDLFFDGYRAIFLGIGVGRPNKLGLLGETLGNVHYAINYLKTPENYILGKKVVIIGAGNVAIDAARSVIRKNFAEVSILNRFDQDKITADKSELDLAILDGANIINNVQVVRIKEDKVVCVAVNKVEHENGSISYEEDFTKQIEIEADSVIIAIGQGLNAEKNYGKIDISNRGLIKVNEYGETSQINVYAAGDVVTGASTVVQSVEDTLRVAKNIIERYS